MINSLPFFGFGLPDAPEGEDPFTLVYNSIWNLLLSRPAFVEKVKVGNRITFTAIGDRKTTTQKDFNKLGADYPEVQLLIEGSLPHHNNTSSSTMVKRTYAVQVNMGDALLSPGLHEIEWEVLVALKNWWHTVPLLEYRNERFVKVVRNLPTTTGYTIREQSHIVGWASIWRAEVEMHFSNVNLV